MAIAIDAEGTSSATPLGLLFVAMTMELAQQLAELGEECVRLKGLLARHPAWLALRQLDGEPAAADAAGGAAQAGRRAELERQLSGNTDYEAFCSVVRAIAEIQSTGVIRQPDSDEAPPKQHPAPQPASLAGTSPETLSVPSESRHIELQELGKSTGAGGVIPRPAIIHGALPGHRDVVADVPAHSPPDDLTRIRRIDRAVAAALLARGVRSFAQIAAFGAADVRSLAVALGLGRRISQENWIEQAAVLALKQRSRVPQAHVATLRHERTHAASAGERGGPPIGSTTMMPDIAAVARAIADDVARRAIGSKSQPPSNAPDEQLESQDASRQAPDDVAPSETAHAAEPDVAATNDATPPGASSTANDAVRAAALRIADQWRMPAPGPQSLPVAAAVDANTDDASRAVAADSGPDDDLTLVRGIDAESHSVLAGLGVTRFAQIAAWRAVDVRAASQALVQARVMANISRDGWIEQAAILARGGRTHYATRVERGEHQALVSRPKDNVVRDDAFALRLAQHAASHAAVRLDAASPEPQAAVVETARAQADQTAVPQFFVASSDDAIARTIVEGPVPEEQASNAIEPREPLVHAEPLSPARTPSQPVIQHSAASTHERPLTPQPAPAADGAAPLPAIQSGAPRSPSSPLASPAVPVIEHAQPDPVEQPEAGSAEDAAWHSPPAAAPAASIADRITAIELEAASLSMRPRPGVKGRRPFEDPAARTGFAEAEVTIVMRDVHDAGPSPTAAADIAEGAPEPLDFDKDDYAAYRGRVDEASVEIVREGRVWGPEDAVVSGNSGSADAVARGQEVAQRPVSLARGQQGRVRRFLKALTGE